ncbi:MAG: peptidylprolyl isomerase [Gemmatimonadetes bacterium]|nr:peptidylprolyl isomerase [Gemmatimonadota bacterium]
MANRYVVFQTTSGTFRAELFESLAPKTTSNFVTLVERGFYDGVVFHRVIKDFMIQGGCPEGTGRGGPGYSIPDEFDAELRHGSAGVLSMANAGPNTGGSQFFITLAPTNWLDNKHAVFGRVVSGMEVVSKIGTTPTDRSDRPLKPAVMERVVVEKEPV